jgi:hypothetical protein
LALIELDKLVVTSKLLPRLHMLLGDARLRSLKPRIKVDGN